MHDQTVKIGNSVINHGKFSDRIYLMKLSKDDLNGIIAKLDELANQKGYSKIFAKIPEFAKEIFEKNGYIVEAGVPKFYDNNEDVFFMSKFLVEKRRKSDNIEIISNVLCTAKNKVLGCMPQLPYGYSYKICDEKDAEEMASIYDRVFETYPFPISDPEYLKKTMNENIIYFGICLDGKLVSLASSEMDVNASNVEMTDFATLVESRGNGFSVFLLGKMEEEMKKMGIKTAYTIARAVSFGMNSTFSKLRYKYAGTLINNTNISGDLESMNVWYKFL